LGVGGGQGERVGLGRVQDGGDQAEGVGAGVAGVDLVLDDADRDVGGQHRVGDAVDGDAGLAGPSSFDCSGFVQYVYRQVGVSLPRTSAQQAAAARPVRRGSEQLGDLIIFRTRGTVTHIGIYAGDGTMWVARRPGTTITRQSIYSGSYSVGRVL
jgi:cell wall-associated NlpC family hydrolase